MSQYSDGFIVIIHVHTKDAEKAFNHPDGVRLIIGDLIDKQYDFQEEVDYTLEVRRNYT